jgi:hypothetical protein
MSRAVTARGEAPDGHGGVGGERGGDAHPVGQVGGPPGEVALI